VYLIGIRWYTRMLFTSYVLYIINLQICRAFGGLMELLNLTSLSPVSFHLPRHEGHVPSEMNHVCLLRVGLSSISMQSSWVTACSAHASVQPTNTCSLCFKSWDSLRLASNSSIKEQSLPFPEYLTWIAWD